MSRPDEEADNLDLHIKWREADNPAISRTAITQTPTLKIKIFRLPVHQAKSRCNVCPAVLISIQNVGSHIDAQLINRIFEYGVSDQPDSGGNGNRGQGLFVAKTYMAKMGGTITVVNIEGDVSFNLSLQRSLQRDPLDNSNVKQVSDLKASSLKSPHFAV